MFKRLKVSAAVAGLLLGISAASLEAAPITGAFSISGNFKPVNGATGASTSSLLTATGIDFIALFGSVSTPGTPGAFLVNSASGSLSTLAGSAGTIRDFSFAGPGSLNYPNLSAPLIAFQTIGGLTFTLSSIAPPVLQTASFLVLSGQGIFQWGVDTAAGTFDFSGNGRGGTFSFSSSNGAVPQVPEPTSLVLLASGLLIASASLRRRGRRAV